MDEPSEMHARLCVVENDCERHEEDIIFLRGKVTDLGLVVNCLPDIQRSLEGIKSDLLELKLKKVAAESQVRGQEKASLWLKYGTLLGPLVAGGILVLAGFALATYAHIHGP